MSRRRWKRAKATVELCQRRPSPPTTARRRRPHKHRDYAVTLSYQIQGELFLTDVVTRRPLKEGSHLILGYDSLDPRRNTLNHPPVYRSRAFLIFVGCFAAGVLLLLLLALVGL